MRQANDLGKPYAGKLHVRFDEGVKEVRTENVGLPLYRLLLLFYSNDLVSSCSALLLLVDLVQSALVGDRV